MKNIAILKFLTLTLLIVNVLLSCNNMSESLNIDRAEQLIESYPDSAYKILLSIDKNNIHRKYQKARYALYMSMALDKNFIDTTSFVVLQPAIDYFIKQHKGTSDEKLKTNYYQGRIFQNRNEMEKALNSFLNAEEQIPNSVDSLSIARLFVAQGAIYLNLYNLAKYTFNNLEAAQIYHCLKKYDLETDCLLRALNGSIIDGNKTKADSIMEIIKGFPDIDSFQNKRFLNYKLSYALKFDILREVKTLIDNNPNSLISDANSILTLAHAFNRLNDTHKAMQIMDYISHIKINFDTLRYQSILVDILENEGDYKAALDVYKQFCHRMDSINLLKFDHESVLMEKKYQIETEARKDAVIKSKIIWGCVGGILLLLLSISILLLTVRNIRIKNDLASQREKTKDLENSMLKSDRDRLRMEREMFELENNNLQLERDKKILESENLSHQVDMLESECERLKNIIKEKETLPKEVREAIQTRLEMLNSMLAHHITSNEKYSIPYNDWLKETTENSNEFMNSNRLAFKASHPKFIQYLENHDLTEKEINYVCLYAIGLRGKEVGAYMKKRSHVNMSSNIRKKLGIDMHETNLGIYVRKLLKNL